MKILELMFYCKKEHQETVDKILYESMEEVNQDIQLNVPITISVDWGNDYSSVH